jgi:hypothetical protein
MDLVVKDVTSVSDIVFKRRVTHAYRPTQPTGAPLRWIAPSPGEIMTYFNTTLHIFLELGLFLNKILFCWSKLYKIGRTLIRTDILVLVFYKDRA